MEPIADVISTVDYHTAGEPFRIVTGTVPPLVGRTILERRRFAAEHLDEVRRFLVFEPRGHADMYGGFVTDPEDDDGDLGVVFFHNAGYSTACGHGTIALVTWALESGRLESHEGLNRVVVDVPSGRLETWATVRDGRVAHVRFRNVPAYVHAARLRLSTSVGSVACDIAFGGAFYASVRAGDVGCTVVPADLPRLIELGREIKRIAEAQGNVIHPLVDELRDVYGVIFFEDLDRDDGELHQRNVTIFADGEVDRSPCGSGTSARLALLDASGELPRGATLLHESIVGTTFTGVVIEDCSVGSLRGVITEVEGSAYLTGYHQFVLDLRDGVGTGFLLR